MTTAVYNFSNIPGFNALIQNDNDIANLSNVLKLHKVECRTSNNTIYRIVRYDKDFLTVDLVPTYGLCRSVIINNNNKVVGIAPPKSIPCDDFIKRYSEGSEGIVAEEFIEGTMVNVFWDDSIGLNGGWEISTRNTVGATSSFYKGPNSKSFRDMFLEALQESNLLLDNLEKEYSYSFVLQHPANRIVVPFKNPRLYLVAVYSIFNEQQGDTTNVYAKVHNAQDFRDVFMALNTSIRFPEIYKFTTYSELVEKYGSMNTSYNVVGVVIHNSATGERSKIRNPVYEQVKNLRGNQPKLQYQYLCLRKEGKVSEFLKFYPENKKNFSTYRDQVHLFTDTLFKNYISCYIKKEQPLILFSDQYRTHMFTIHKLYLNELKEQNKFVNSGVVQKYVNEIHPSLLMYCLNFQMRKRNVAVIAADTANV